MKNVQKSSLLRRALSLTVALLIVCSFSLPSVALAADLGDSSAESSVSVSVLSEQSSDSSAEASTSAGEGSEEESTSGDSSAPEQGTEDEVAASLDDDVGSDFEYDPPELRGSSVLGADESGDGSESAEEAEPEESILVDPYADDGAGEGGQSEDVAETPTLSLTTQEAVMRGAASTVNLDSQVAGVEINYAADSTTSFKTSSLKAGQVWVDKSVSKTSDTETSFSETLSVYTNKFTTESEYSTGNYVLVLDTTRSLYNADHSGKLVKAVTKATNDIIVEICKNPLSNVAVVGFSADNRERDKNKNADATTVILGMGNWKSAGKSLLTCDTSDDNECKWYIGPTDAAKNAGIASTHKRYISYGTFTQAGVAHAASILKAQTDKADTAGYMLILTDGVPTYGTKKWAANYDTSNAAWQSGTSSSIGNGGGADPTAAAYTLMTMQYWNKVLKGQYASFSSGNDAQVIEGLPADNYRLVTDGVPSGYVLPAYTAITVNKQTARQHFDIYVHTILIDVWAIDKATEEMVEGVTATILDSAGRAVYDNVPLEFLQEYVPAGDYTIRINTVPDRYQKPADTPITVQAIREKQDFIIPLEHLGSITIRKTDDHGAPVQGASYDLTDSTGRVIMTRTTDRDGVAVFSDRDKLVQGEYIITETKTGAGLTLLSDSIRATIPLTMNDAEVRARGADTSKGWHNARTGTWYFYDLTFNVTNSAKFTMPMSGDIPTVLRLCIASGMTGLLAGTAYLVYRRRTVCAESINLKESR